MAYFYDAWREVPVFLGYYRISKEETLADFIAFMNAVSLPGESSLSHMMELFAVGPDSNLEWVTEIL